MAIKLLRLLKTKMKNLSVSQNFLVNSDFVNKLVSDSSLSNDDLVVEIGSGKGIITEVLSNIAKEVIAVEYDHRLFLKLKNRFANTPNVKVLNVDFLKYNLPVKPFKVFSNPPFNISADILNKLLKLPNNLDVAYLFLQDKTVERFVNETNQVAVLYKPFYDISIVKKVNRNEFSPIPKVDIVFAKFEKINDSQIDMSDYQLYRDFVIYGFNQWKPTVVESFNKVFTKEQFKIINKKYNMSNLKPSDLNLNQWIYLFGTFMSYVPSDKKVIVSGFETKLKSKQKGMIKRHRTNV